VFTSATDLFPEKVSGAVVGLGAMTGGIGGMFMTLLVALTVQWTGNQQAVFVWAGIMHPVSLLIYWFWIGKRFESVNVERLPDLTRSHAPLLAAGVATAVFGLVISVLIYRNWQAAVSATSMAGAAQAATAAVGVLLIGGALFYAGMPGRRTAA
jgi:ACS family hexuronate transporter-like MFS transporter